MNQPIKVVDSSYSLVVEQPLITSLLTGQLSSNTLRAYKLDLEQFFGLSDIHSLTKEQVQAVTSQRIIDYRNELLKRYRPVTVARKLSTLRTAFQYFVDLGIASHNPAKNSLVKSPKVPTESTSECLTKQEAESMIVQPDRSTLVGKRDYAILLLMFNNGLRRSEVTNAKICDLKQEGSYFTLSIIGKGGKFRVAKLKPQIWDSIQEYLKSRSISDSQERIFINHSRGKAIWQKSINAITGESIRQLVKKYAERAGINKRLFPHVLRSSFTTLAIESGAKIHQVQIALGHSDPKVTMRYFRHRNNLVDNATDYVHLSVNQ